MKFIFPLQYDGMGAGSQCYFLEDVNPRAAEVVCQLPGKRGRSRYRLKSTFIRFSPEVAGRCAIDHILAGYVVNCFGYMAILVERLCRMGNIIDYYFVAFLL